MHDMKNDLIKKLPAKSVKEIAKLSNVSETTVRSILKGKNEKSTKKAIVIRTAIEYLKEIKQKESELKAEFEKVLNTA